MSNPENPTVMPPEQQPQNPEQQGRSWVPQFVTRGIEKALHSVRQERMDRLNDKIQDVDTTPTQYEAKAENIQYKNTPRATENANLTQIYDGLRDQPEGDGFVRTGALRKFKKNDKVVSGNVSKADSLLDKSKSQKDRERGKLERKKQNLKEKDSSLVDKSEVKVTPPNTVQSRNKARTQEVQSKLEENLKSAHAISLREILRTIPEDSEKSQDTKIDEFSLRSSLKKLDGSAQALAAMTMTTLQSNKVIDSEGKVTLSRHEIEDLISELDPEGNTANYRTEDVPEVIDSNNQKTSTDNLGNSEEPDASNEDAVQEQKVGATGDARPHIQEYQELPPAVGMEAATDQVISSSEDEEGNADSDGNESQEKTEDSNDEVKEEKATEDASSESEQELEDTENTEDTSEKKPENTEFKSTTGIDVATLQSLSKEISQSISDTVRATKQERNLGNEDKLPKQDYESIRDNSVEANIKAWLIDKGIVNKSNPELLERFYRHIKTDLDNYRKHVRS